MRTQKDIAFQSPEAIDALNRELLCDQVAYCYRHSPFYRKCFDSLKLSPKDITSQKDLALLPVTSKSDLDTSPAKFLSVPESKVIDHCLTSGTTGKPVTLLQTEMDLRRLGYNEWLSFQAAGVTCEDRVLIACALGRCFMAGLAYFEGVRQLGAAAIRVGSGHASVIAQAILDHRPSVVVIVPSQAILIAETLQKRGIDLKFLGVRTFICIGEPVRNAQLGLSCLGKRLKDFWASEVIGTYASTEVATSFTDCTVGCGGHFHPELITVEIVDEEGAPVGPGEVGEIIATPLQVTGMPLLRFRTSDMAVYHSEPCACGRNTFRLGPIVGRKQQKIKISGTTVYPSAIFSLLQEIAGVRNYYLEVYDEFALSERARVVVGTDKGAGLTAEMIAEKLRDRIRIKLEVVIEDGLAISSKTQQEGKRKPVLFFDYRTKQLAGI
jgi:phenylacetate-CoA ligase